MKAIEFQTQLDPSGAIAVPQLIASQLAPGQRFRVLLLVEETDEEEEDWRRLAAAGFFREDHEGDAQYDH
jgi:hypothetical protein